MRRVASLLVVLSIISIPSYVGGADDPKVDFDQGVDASALLNRAHQSVPGTNGARPRPLRPILERIKLSPQMEEKIANENPLPDRPFAPGALRPCESYVPENDGRASGKLGETLSSSLTCTEEERLQFIWGDRAKWPYEPASAQSGTLDDAYARIPADSQAYKNSEYWLAQVPRLPVAQRPPFESQHRNISATRANLIADGRGHDQAEVQLVERAKALNVWSARIDARRKLIEQDRAEYNQTCIDNPNPPAKLCKDWFDRGNACVGRHNSSVQRYQPVAAQFRTDRDKHFGNVDNFKTRIRVWEAQEVLPFNQGVEQALIKNPAGKCEADVWEALVKKKDQACSGVPKACSEADHCADIAASMKVNKACKEAAEQLNEQCFEGKHPEHSNTVAEAIKALNACQAIFAKKCSGWDPITGKCDADTHGRYQALAEAACNRDRSCDRASPGDCDMLRDFLGKNIECYTRQDAINFSCYEGGDANHRKKADEARKAATKCNGRIADECVDPQLRYR